MYGGDIGIENRGFKCSTALGLQTAGESLTEYLRRAGYELDRLDAIAEQHRRWHTHLDTRSAECFICAYQHLSRCYLRVLADYGRVEADAGNTEDDVEEEMNSEEEEVNSEEEVEAT